MLAMTKTTSPGFWSRLGHWLRAIDAAFDHDPHARLERRVVALEAKLAEGERPPRG